MDARPVVAVFADCGPADLRRAVYQYAGEILGKKGAHVIIPLIEGQWPESLVSELGRHPRVTLTFVASADAIPADIPAGAKLEIAQDRRAAAMKAADMARAIVGLPAGFDTVSRLYTAWADIGGAKAGTPVGLLNRKHVFEVVKGFFSDVASVGLGNIDHHIQISDNFDDLLNRLSRLQT